MNERDLERKVRCHRGGVDFRGCSVTIGIRLREYKQSARTCAAGFDNVFEKLPVQNCRASRACCRQRRNDERMGFGAQGQMSQGAVDFVSCCRPRGISLLVRAASPCWAEQDTITIIDTKPHVIELLGTGTQPQASGLRLCYWERNIRGGRRPGAGARICGQSPQWIDRRRSLQIQRAGRK